MPKIPTYQAQVEYRPALGDVDAAGAPGRMLARFGQLAGEVGGQIAETVAARAKTAAAEAERAKGTARAMAALRRTVDGFAADSDPGSMMERYLEQADGIGRDISSGIRDSGARGRFDADFKNLAAVHGTLVQRDMLRNLAGQGRRELDDHLGLYAETAAAASHPVEHDDMVALALREIRGKAEAGFITQEDAGRLARGFHADLAERQTRRHIAADPEAALAWLKTGAESAGLGADSRARLTAEAERAARAQTVRRDTETAAARRDTLTGLSDYLTALRDDEATDDPRFSREHLTATFGAEDGAKRWAEIEDARAFGAAMARVKWATPGEIAERTAGLAGESVSSEAGALLARVVARRDEQLHAKPADYVLKNPRIAELHRAMGEATAQPPVASAVASALWQASGNTAAPSVEDRRATTAAYANGTLAEQERLGVPEAGRQLLPESMAKEIVTGILGSDPAKADRTLVDLAKDWGAEWPRALADLRRAGLPSAYHLLAGFDDPVARQTLTKVLTAQASEPGALRAKISADAAAIDESVDRHRAGVDSRILSDDHGKLVKLLAYHYAQTTEPEDAARRAIGDLGGNALLQQGPHTTGDGAGGSDDMMSANWGGWPDEIGQSHELADTSIQSRSTPKGVPMVDRNGNPIIAATKEQALIPQGWNLNFFIRKGQEDAHKGLGAFFFRLANGPTPESIKNLANFRRGGPWDLQRFDVPAGETMNRKFRDGATIAIGVYSKAAGMTLNESLRMQQAYAILTHTQWGKDDERSFWYYPLPKRNVENTEIGYNLAR